MGIFDRYKGDAEYEELPVIKSKQLLNIPFKIERLYFKENMESEFGSARPVMVTTVQIVETGERFVYFAENTVVLKKLVWIKDGKIDITSAKFKLVYTEGAANNYYDIVEA